MSDLGSQMSDVGCGMSDVRLENGTGIMIPENKPAFDPVLQVGANRQNKKTE